MKIKVFADTICGWCYIGHSRLLNAFRNFENISFDVDVKEGEHQLAIERQNKTTKDTLLKNLKIIKDSKIFILNSRNLI